MKYLTRNWTYGAELELSDIDRRKPPVEWCGWDVRDFTMVNSNGIAVDPKGIMYPYGGEINTQPTNLISEQVSVFRKILRHYPEASVNYRSNLHIHIRVPGLRDSLEDLKRVQKFIHEEMPFVFPRVEPIPVPSVVEYSGEELKGALRRYRRRKISHHTLLTPKRLEAQLRAATVPEFFEAEVPKTKKTGTPMWHAQPRLCVNLRQLRETDTVEFRHFPLSLDSYEFESALFWCHNFLNCALNYDVSCLEMLTRKDYKFEFPKFPPYVHWMEERYRMTCHDGSVPKEQIKENIERFLNEDSSGVPRKRKPQPVGRRSS